MVLMLLLVKEGIVVVVALPPPVTELLNPLVVVNNIVNVDVSAAVADATIKPVGENASSR